MWNKGTIIVNGIESKYCVKYYAEPSEEYSINGGRISKLYDIIIQNYMIISLENLDMLY